MYSVKHGLQRAREGCGRGREGRERKKNRERERERERNSERGEMKRREITSR